MLPSISGQRSASQMMPTPGFNSTNNISNTNNSNSNYINNNNNTCSNTYNYNNNNDNNSSNNNNSNNSNNDDKNNIGYMSLESYKAAGFSTVESAAISLPPQQKLHVGGQSSCILPSLGGHMGGGIRSGLQQNSRGFVNGALTGDLGVTGNNLQVVNGPGTSESYPTAPLYGTSTKQSQLLDQHQRQILQGTSLDASPSNNMIKLFF